MRELIVTTFLTLDGVMQAPGGPEEDPVGNFRHGGWSVNYWDEMMGEFMDGVMGKPFDLVLGRKTYEIFAAHWPNASEEEGAGPLNAATKYVASRTLSHLEWGPSAVLEGDVTQAIRELKRKDGPELQVHGSSDLLQTLLRSDLIDRFYIWTFPVLVGAGKRLFGDGTTAGGLKLVQQEVSSTGVTIGVYESAGELITGSFALEGPS